METRLNELLDSIHCRQVLARLKAQGYSDHVAQVGAGAAAAACGSRQCRSGGAGLRAAPQLPAAFQSHC